MRCGAADTLTAESLSVAGPGGPIVRNVSFRLRRGGATCLVGETGVGKSLVAQTLLGLLPPGLRAEGCLILPGGRRFDLSDPARLHPLWGRELFLLPQEPREALDPTARMLGQVAEALPAPDRAGVAAGLLARFGIGRRAARSVPAALSGGMAQRGLMAIASAVPAPILVVDEPTKGLDPQRLAEVVDALGTMCAEGRSLLVVTHDLSLCLALKGDILVLHGGEVVESGLAKTVLSDPGHRWTRELAAAQPTNWPARVRTPCSAAPVLEATRVSFAWPGGKTLFRDVSLRACPGRIIGIAGASGVGKSTLCDILTGLRRPAEGSVSWGGKDPGTMNRTDRVAGQRRFQKLHQDPGASFPPHRRLRSIFADLAAVTEAPLQRLAALMERLRLRPDTLDRLVGEISGGEAQRLALARALLLRPSVLVADEPTSRLDAITQAEISRLLREAADRDGLAIVWVSHDASLLRALADDVLHLC